MIKRTSNTAYLDIETLETKKQKLENQTGKENELAGTNKIEESIDTSTNSTETNTPTVDDPNDIEFCEKLGFNKSNWINSLTEEQKSLLQLEINTLNITWLALIHKELTKPYFLNLKSFLKSQSSTKTIFPKTQNIYSWSNLTPVYKIKCLILGQDPYHNHNQAHGLAFSVLEPNRPPPSLINIYKTLAIDYPGFKIPNFKELSALGIPGGGNLTKWSKQGVLLLNTILTVEAHKANSHKNKGWEKFTEKCIELVIKYYLENEKNGFVIMAWGSPAQKSIEPFIKLMKNNDDRDDKFLVLKTVHPSPLSARRGFFESNVFKKCNNWLVEHDESEIDWRIID
ncbi:UNG1 [Candida pseudojiufengensis]|uniref:UNG1 n=1 Tax=Candida pseudojiufengensis TaxID=497109 RepID=UPI0022247AEC|nr:UNG1 [Candida pseudojiufengensis]KAI5959175.1 UNG1 [Candida pseudojiufengensis]